MDTGQLEERIVQRGRDIFARIDRHKPSVFSTKRWVRKIMDWTMSREQLKREVFILVNVLPELTTEEMLYRHIRESFLRAEDLPCLLRLGVNSLALMGKPGRVILGAIVHKSVKMMGLQFIIGSSVDQTIARLGKLREREGFAFTLDVLGEETTDAKDVDRYVESYLGLLAGLEKVQSGWKSLGQGDSALDWGGEPKVNISVKPSALYAHADPDNFEETVGHMLGQLKRIYREVVRSGAFLCIDIEMLKLREITFELYRRLRSDPEFRDCPHLGLAMQVYLKDADEQLNKMIKWARSESLPISIRLTKGAYWEHEVALAEQNNQPVPVYTIKAQTDMAFERAAQTILRNHDICRLACASHNLRSISAVAEQACALDVGHDRYEFQVLYGMAAGVRKAILESVGRVRLYCPHGELLRGMAYLVRRLLENTSNESFVHQVFDRAVDRNRLLENPKETLERVN